MRSNLIPDILPLFQFGLHDSYVRTNIALLIKLIFIRSVRVLHIGILLGCSRIDEIVGKLLFLAQSFEFFQEFRPVIGLDSLNLKRKLCQAMVQKVRSVSGGQ